jgi:hypothetical protein
MDLRIPQEVVISPTGGTCGLWQAVDAEYEVTARLTDPFGQIQVRRISDPGWEQTAYFLPEVLRRDLAVWHPAGDLLEVMALAGDWAGTVHVRRAAA